MAKLIVYLDRSRNPDLPQGEVDVLVDGSVARFMKIAVNVVHRPGSYHTVLLEVIDDRWVIRAARS